ncbi:phage tail protein [bacterium]|nr:phage tail protein [bacterium]
MSEPFLGEIKMFAGNFAPRGFALADGQLLPISQYTALFSLYGVVYGGNGTSTFALPDLRGRAPMHWGNGAGLSPHDLGERAGTPSVTLTVNEIPGHTHGFVGEDEEANQTAPNGNALGVNPGVNWYTTPGAPGLQLQNMSPLAVGAGGGGQPHNNTQPFLAVTFIVAMAGIFPARP